MASATSAPEASLAILACQGGIHTSGREAPAILSVFEGHVCDWPIAIGRDVEGSDQLFHEAVHLLHPCMISIRFMIARLAEQLGCACASAAWHNLISLTYCVISCRPTVSAYHSVAAWGILRTAAVELAGQAWHGLDCSSMSHAALHVKVMPHTLTRNIPVRVLSCILCKPMRSKKLQTHPVS